MITSSQAVPGSSGFINEPPLSPGAAPSAPTPAPVTQLPSRPSTPSIEAQVVRLGLLTPDQVATAMREEAETGRTFDEIVVGHGWVSAEDLARVREPVAAPAPPPVAAVPDPEPIPAPPVAAVPDPEPELDPEPEPEVLSVPAPVVAAEVFVRLSNGERVVAGSFGSEGEAEGRARDLMRALDGEGSWPQLDGRFIRPDAVVSIDVELAS